MVVPAYYTFSKYKCLIVDLVFFNIGFWSGNFFLFVPFPDHCILLLFYELTGIVYEMSRIYYGTVSRKYYEMKGRFYKMYHIDREMKENFYEVDQIYYEIKVR